MPPQTAPPGPPLLLTKRLVAFLQTSLTPSLTTAFLATPSGKLLAHASTDASSTTATLRTRATVASLLWDIHASSSVAAAEATSEGARRLKGESSSVPSSYASSSYLNANGSSMGGTDDHGSTATTLLGGDPELGHNSRRSSTSAARKPSTITVQLERSVVVVRRLGCGILLVASGPIEGPHTSTTTSQAQIHNQHLRHGASPGTTPPSAHDIGGSVPGSSPPPVEASSPGNLPTPTILEPSLPSSSHTAPNPPVVPVGFHPSPPGGSGVGVPPPNRGSGVGAGPSPQHLAVGSPSDSIMSAGASSIASIGAQGAVLLRRQAEEVAQMLDSKLVGLRVPNERIGAEFVR